MIHVIMSDLISHDTLEQSVGRGSKHRRRPFIIVFHKICMFFRASVYLLQGLFQVQHVHAWILRLQLSVWEIK